MSTSTRPSLHASEKLGQIAHGFVASSAINAIARLGIADLLKDGPLSDDDLAKQSATDKDALCRVMRFLCSLGIFSSIEPNKFSNNDVSEYMRQDVEGSQRDMLLFIANPFHFKAYTDMLPTIRDGKTASEHVWGKGIFDVFADDEEEQVLFNNAMTNFSNRAIDALLAAYDFSGIEKLVDVAGGHGALLTGVLQKYPSMKGVLFELEHVAEGAKDNIKKQNLTDRCDVVTGDFFKSVPGGDAIIMKHIIHDWNDECALTILKNCSAALSKTGKLLLVEFILAEPNEPHMSRFMDIEMLMLPGGRERSEKDFAKLFEKAGFELTGVVTTKGPWAVIEAQKS